MLNRSLVFVVVFVASVGHAAPASAANLFAQLFPLTGEVRLINKSVSTVPISAYQIDSAAGALIGTTGVWKTITENYDAPFGLTPGNGFVDPDGEWIKFPPTSMQLAEGALDANGGSLMPWRPVSLGRIWNSGITPFSDLMFTAFEPNDDEINVTTELALDGDYFADRVVNQTDYGIWRQYFGSTSVLIADGNIDGTINAADYVVWRDNLGKSIAAAAHGSAVAAAFPSFAVPSSVPEPGTVLLAAVLAWLAVGARFRRSC